MIYFIGFLILLGFFFDSPLGAFLFLAFVGFSLYLIFTSSFINDVLNSKKNVLGVIGEIT